MSEAHTPISARSSGGAAPPIQRMKLGDLTGAVADLGVLVPLAAALILVNGLDPSAVFVGAGLLVLAAGAIFRVPFPVQPLKALTAVAVANELSGDVINAAGLEIAVFLVLLSIGRVADVISRAFTQPVVRALQLGVGVLLVLSAYKLVDRPPDVFTGTPSSPWPVAFAVVALVVVALAARYRWYALALVMLAGGAIAAGPSLHGPTLTLPDVGLPAASAFGTAFVLLVIPQLPLTFGNAVVAVADVSQVYFGDRAARVTPTRVCLSCGIGNAASGLLGGMPMCHGSGGLTAHVRLGASTAWMNALLGSVFIGLGVFFAPQVTVLLGLLPVWALAAFLAYAGLRHTWLVADLRGARLALAIVAGTIGALTGNLAYTLGIALAVDHLVMRRRVPTPA